MVKCGTRVCFARVGHVCASHVLRDALLTRRAAWAVASSVSASLLSVVVDEPVRQREVNFALEGGVLVEWA